MISDERINQYLYYGYCIKEKDASWIDNYDYDYDCEYNISDFSYTREFASSIFERIFEESVSFIDDDAKVLIPVSGGWDSRLLLGAALDKFENDRLYSFSFGTEGLLDYVIGKQVCSRFGVKHISCDLNQIEITWNGLVSSVMESPWTYVPDSFFIKESIKQAGYRDNDVVLSGFFGEALTGGHCLEEKTEESTLREFVKKQRKVSGVELIQVDYNPIASVQNQSRVSSFSYSDQLDFSIRQSNCIAPIVTPELKVDKWKTTFERNNMVTVTPFCHPLWAKYWSTVPINMKRNQSLYVSMMRYKYHELFDLPSKYSCGYRYNQNLKIGSQKIFNKLNRGLYQYFPRLIKRKVDQLNYIDFDAAFRERDDYGEIIGVAIDILENRGYVSWLNSRKLLEQHMDYKKNYGDVLMLLIGLAANIYVEENKLCNGPKISY